MINRIIFGIIVANFLTTVSMSQAQPSARLRKIGFLSTGGSPSATFDSFYQGMRELGYVDGKNIVIDFRSGNSQSELVGLAKQLVQQNVEVIVAAGAAASAAKAATSTVPIVFTFSGDPIEAGLIESLARPGRNLTGITWLAFELVGKRLEILKEAVPRISRVAVLASPLHAGERRELKETESAARALGIDLQYNQVKDIVEIKAAFKTVGKANANALLAFPDPVTNAHRKQIVEFAASRRLPSMFGRKEPVEDGGLLSYGPKLEEVYRRIPVHVDKILKGASPAEIPTELPMSFEFFVNLKTAKQIGVEIPQWTLMKADRVIR